MVLWGLHAALLPGGGGSDQLHGELNSLGWLTVERESRVDGCCVTTWCECPSSSGLVESAVNLPRPLGKPEYSKMTDSG